MGNIFAFLVRHHKFLIFILLEGLCFSLVVNYNKPQGSVFFRSTYEITGRIYKGFDALDAYFHLSQVNDSLMAENARLRGKLNSAKYYDTSRGRNVTDTLIKQRYTFVPCSVVNNSVSGRDNYLTLDIGTNRGIGKHQGVVTTSGIAGITRDNSSHFSSALSVLNKDFTVSAEIKECKQIGTVTWDGLNPDLVVMKDIPLNVRLKIGMHVVTSHYSDIFPTGTNVGVISRFIMNHNDAYYTVFVKLSTDMRNLRQVYVVNNLMNEEKLKIEEVPVKK